MITARHAVFPQGMLVIEREHMLIGYGSAEKWHLEREPVLNEHPADTHHPAGQILCITAMAIRPAYQRQGYGTALLQHFIEIARSHACRQIILETTHAQAFYERHGFQRIREREERGVTLSVLQLTLALPTEADLRSPRG